MHYKNNIGPKQTDAGIPLPAKSRFSKKAKPKSHRNRAFPEKSKHSIKTSKNLKRLYRMLIITLPILFDGIPEEDWKAPLKYILHLYRSKGPEFVIRYLKATQETLEHILFALPGTLQHEKVSIGLDKDHWPKWLGSGLKRSCLTERNIMSLRLAFTLCSIRRMVTIPTFTHLESITKASHPDPYTIRRIVRQGRKTFINHLSLPNPQIGSFIEEQGEGIVVTTPTPSLEISSKKGPNGTSFFNFPWDRAAILEHNLKDKLICFTSKYYSGDVLQWFEDKLNPYKELLNFNKQTSVGSVSLTFEAGKLKPRVFAIVESVTQSVLRPFHTFLMGILRRISEDCTFDHNKVSRIARKLHSKGHAFYGFADLSNATDSIPKEIYAGIGNIFKEGLGDSWVSLFDRDFKVSKSVRDNWTPGHSPKQYVRYTTGQPMGALSSWPFMALVHHCIVWTAFRGRSKSRGKYLILGDDIVIFDRKAYNQYCNLLDKLAITYTHSFSTKGFEFAKRIFYNGTEITGAYTSALWASRNVPELFSMEWRTLATRGYKSGTGLPESLRTLLKVSRKRFEACRLMMEVPYGTTTPVAEIAKFTNFITGRSNCFLQVGKRDRYVDAVKAFRQTAALLIKQRFQKLLLDAKEAIEKNKILFQEAFQAHWESEDRATSIIQEAISEYHNDSIARIRYLERDLKRTYLASTKTITSKGGSASAPPTVTVRVIETPNKVLLRPNLPQLPRLLNFYEDAHTAKLKFRAQHQMDIIRLLRG